MAKKNYSFISDHLYSQIKNSLNSKKSVFLFVNKKGQSSATICRDCNYAFNCPHCQLPLIKNEQNQFICYTCNYSEEVPPFCPRCSGPNLRSSGIGIQKIEAALKKLLPKANVVRLDKDINNQSPVSQTGKIEPKQSINHQPAKLKKLSQNKASIIIGTAFALDKIAWPQIDLLGIINADQLWQHIEFMANETAYQLMIKLLTLAPKNAKFIIQTFSPEHHLLKSIIKNNPAIFYEKELKFRKQFNYPPFVYLIKLSCLNKSELKTKKQAQKIYRLLKKTIANKNSIYPPLPILRKKIRGKYKYNLILKINKIDDFGHLTKFVPNNWLIDIQARTLLD